MGGVTQGYQWDVEGELTSAGGEVYTYDASGNRMLRESAAGLTVYLPGGQELLITGSAADSELSATRYYSFAGSMVAMRTAGGLSGVTSFVADHHGSLIAAIPNTNAAANAVQRIYTDPFGGARTGSDDLPGDRGFLGAVEDATGLTLLGARYYDPHVGSFISVDPLLRPGVPAHFHAYAYAFNNPVSKSDPSGLEPRDEHGNYDGNPYGQKKPASTSWGALESCRDVGCRLNWNLQFQVNFAGAIVQGLAGLVWSTCSICMAGESLKRGVDFFGDPQGNMDRSAAATNEFWSDPWNNFWRPFAEDWANNPGNAWGGTVFLAATVAVPGGAAIRTGTAAVTTARVTSRLQHLVDDAVASFDDPSGVLRLSPAQSAAAANNPRLAPMFRGSVIDRAVREGVQRDTWLQSKVSSPTTGPLRPDFVLNYGRGWLDMTTVGQWSKHVDKYADVFGRGIHLVTG